MLNISKSRILSPTIAQVSWNDDDIYHVVNGSDHLLPVHVDHGGGDGDHHAEQGWEEAETATDLDEDTLAMRGLGEQCDHQTRENHLKHDRKYRGLN